MVQLKNLRCFVLFSSLFSFCSIAQATYQYTPSDVFTEALQVKQEIEIIRQHFKSPKTNAPTQLNVQLKPRNVWQKTYEIFVKINILRSKNDLPRIEESSLEPVKNLDPGLVYEQIRRILSELAIFKTRVGIKGHTKPVAQQQNKTPSDVYHLLNSISTQLDSINGKSFTPSFVFAQNMRILEDINTILEKLNIHDRSSPPDRIENTLPTDVFDLSLKVLFEIQRLHTMADIDSVDFSTIKSNQHITPSNVFSMTGIILSSLQPVKAYLHLNQQVTPPANIYNNKQPADALQALGWGLRKIRHIEHLNN